VLEVESFITANASVELCLKPNGSNLFVYCIFTFLVLTPAPDLEKVFTSRNLLQVRVPFQLVDRVFSAEIFWQCAFIVQLVGHHGIIFLDDFTFCGFTADVADTCGEGAVGSLNQLLLYGLDFGPVRTILSLIEGRQAIAQGLAHEVPRVGRLHARHSEKVVRSPAINEELECEGWLKA